MKQPATGAVEASTPSGVVVSATAFLDGFERAGAGREAEAVSEPRSGDVMGEVRNSGVRV